MTAATTAPAILGTAHRVTMRDARAHFLAGGAVLVSEYGHELETPVTAATTVHTRDRISWDELADMVTMWRSRYPNQRFYRVTYAPNACTWPPALMPADSLAIGDMLPVVPHWGTVAAIRARRDVGAVIVTTSTGRDFLLYTDESVHVSREVSA